MAAGSQLRLDFTFIAPWTGQAQHGRHADVGCHIESPQLNAGRREPVQQRRPQRRIGGRQIERGGVLLGIGQQAPQRQRVALDCFAQRVAQRFEHMVAGGEAARRGLQRPVGGPTDGIVGADEIKRHPAARAGEQVAALDPLELGVAWIGGRVRRARQARRIHGKQAPFGDFGISPAHMRPHDLLRVPRLRCLHQRRRLRSRQRRSLALEDGDRAGVRAVGSRNRDAERVETGEVREPRDAKARPERQHPRKRLFRCDDAMRTITIALGALVGQIDAARQGHHRASGATAARDDAPAADARRAAVSASASRSSAAPSSVSVTSLRAAASRAALCRRPACVASRARLTAARNVRRWAPC